MPTLQRRTEQKKQGRNFRWVYRSERWHRASKAQLRKQPLCEICLIKGKTDKAEVTDHKIPLVIWVWEMGRDPFDSVNFQSLSKRCHNQKSAYEKHNSNKI